MRLTVIDMRPRLLSFVDEEIIGALVYHLRQQRVTFRLGEKVTSVSYDENTDKVITQLESGKRVITEKALYSIGRTGSTGKLNLDNAGLTTDNRGRLKVNENFQTDQPHIYAVGDVIGFPSLASTSMEQGRLAAAHAFGIETTSIPELFPYGIYAIPEISMVGKTEEELTEAGIPYEIGKANAINRRDKGRSDAFPQLTGMIKTHHHMDQAEHRTHYADSRGIAADSFPDMGGLFLLVVDLLGGDAQHGREIVRWCVIHDHL